MRSICVYTHTGTGKAALKDENGFKSKIKLRFAPKIANLSDIVNRDLDLAVSMSIEISIYSYFSVACESMHIRRQGLV